MMFCEAALVPSGLSLLFYYFYVRKEFKFIHVIPAIIYIICLLWIFNSGSNNKRFLVHYGYGDIEFSFYNTFSYLSQRVNELLFNFKNLLLLLLISLILKPTLSKLISKGNIGVYSVAFLMNLLFLCFLFIYGKGWLPQERYDNYMLLFFFSGIIPIVVFFLDQFKTSYLSLKAPIIALFPLILFTSSNNAMGVLYGELISGDIKQCFYEVYKMTEYLKENKNEQCLIPSFSSKPKTTYLDLILAKNSGNNKFMSKVYGNKSIESLKNISFENQDLYERSIVNASEVSTGIKYYCFDKKMILLIDKFDDSIFTEKVRAYIYYNHKRYWIEPTLDKRSNIIDRRLAIFLDFPCDLSHQIEIYKGGSENKQKNDLIYDINLKQ